MLQRSDVQLLELLTNDVQHVTVFLESNPAKYGFVDTGAALGE